MRLAVCIALSLALSLVGTLRAEALSLTIDNFEEGPFSVTFPVGGPITFSTVSGLASGNTVGGVRETRIGVTGAGGTATTSLTLSAGDDGAQTTSSGPASTNTGVHFGYDGVANGATDDQAGTLNLDVSAYTHLLIEISALSPGSVGFIIRLADGASVETDILGSVNAVGTYAVPLSNFNPVDLTDIHAIGVNLYALDGGDSITISEFRLVPEPGVALLGVVSLALLGLRRRREGRI